MMMKIFGAVLIVSGGFLFGKIKSSQLSLRLKVIGEIAELFRVYDLELRELRRSPDEVFQSGGELAGKIINNQPIKGLTQTDHEQLERHLCCLRAESYREAIAANKAFLEQLDSLLNALRRETASSGKALPLVMSTVGLFVAVMLF